MKIDADLLTQVEYLTKNPREIPHHWADGKSLFAHVRNYDVVSSVIDDMLYANALAGKNYVCGCLTQIRQDRDCKAVPYLPLGKDLNPDETLRKAIISDERIPDYVDLITVDHLPIFAEWQQRIRNYYKTGVLEEIPTPPPRAARGGCDDSDRIREHDGRLQNANA